MRIVSVVGLVALLAGCATAASPPAPGTQTFAGEVWTWDEKESIVTLMQDGGQLVRVKVTPDTMRTLRHHQYTRVTGTVAPPADMVIAAPPVGPVNAVPKGQPQMVELTGPVTAVDPAGRLTLTSQRGPVQVWVAPGADQRFRTGTPVNVHISIQPVDLVATSAPTPPSPAPVGAPAASPTSGPGDHAVVTGRIVGINPGGILTVESPTGPIQVLAGDTRAYKVGDWIQVRTSVRAAS
jgi:hypothetical protein